MPHPMKTWDRVCSTLVPPLMEMGSNCFSTRSRLDPVINPYEEVYFLFIEEGGPLPCVKLAFQAIVDKVTGTL